MTMRHDDTNKTRGIHRAPPAARRRARACGLSRVRRPQFQKRLPVAGERRSRERVPTARRAVYTLYALFILCTHSSLHLYLYPLYSTVLTQLTAPQRVSLSVLYASPARSHRVTHRRSSDRAEAQHTVRHAPGYPPLVASGDRPAASRAYPTGFPGQFCTSGGMVAAGTPPRKASSP